MTRLLARLSSIDALRFARAAAAGVCVLIAACGGADAPPPPESGPVVPAATPPVITQQPTDASIVTGQPASFTVAASGTAPLAYRWQRNGADIAGATTPTYSIATTSTADSGAVFHVVVSNVAGQVTSRDATLTVASAPPVLTITQQPVDVTVGAGSTATFTVAATCSSGTLDIQWQRRTPGEFASYVSVSGATSASYAFTVASTDDGDAFRAQLDCSGQAATTSAVARLQVTPAGGVVLADFNVVGLRDQAVLSGSNPAIDQEASGSYVFTSGNRILRLSADLSSIVAVAGRSGTQGHADGVGLAASFYNPNGLAHDALGNVYVADTSNNSIRRIAADGTVTTLAGAADGSPGNIDATGTAARFSTPWGITMGPDGDLYVADAGNSLVRRVTTAGVVTTYAGSTVGFADAASATAAQFYQPVGIAAAANGDVLVGDGGNSRVRRIVRAGNGAGAVQTLAGSANPAYPFPDGTGSAAQFGGLASMVVRGNVLTIRDSAGLLRQVDLTSAVVTTLTGLRATTGAGWADGPPSIAQLRTRGAVALGANNGFVAFDDLGMRTVDASGTVTTFASTNTSGEYGGDEASTGVLAQLPLANVKAVAADGAGGVLVGQDQMLRHVDSTGHVSLVAGLFFGNGLEGMVDGFGSAAQLTGRFQGLARDGSGNFYFGDYAAVSKVTPDGRVALFAGPRVVSSTIDPSSVGAVNGSAAAARFNNILGVTAGPDGAVYVADGLNYAIRRIDTAGNVTTFAGALGQSGSVDGPVASARLKGPIGLSFAPDGSLYFTDSDGRLRRVSADGTTVSTVYSGVPLKALAVGTDGTVYAGSQTGLYALSPGATTPTQLIAGFPNDAVVLGNSPHLGSVDGLAVFGPKQLVIISTGTSSGRLLLATLP